ncbi:MAG TPA: hypothetical protein VGB97_03365 [Candidatus Paceibacterota bacterium]
MLRAVGAENGKGTFGIGVLGSEFGNRERFPKDFRILFDPESSLEFVDNPHGFIFCNQV